VDDGVPRSQLERKSKSSITEAIATVFPVVTRGVGLRVHEAIWRHVGHLGFLIDAETMAAVLYDFATHPELRESVKTEFMRIRAWITFELHPPEVFYALNARSVLHPRFHSCSTWIVIMQNTMFPYGKMRLVFRT
jgi:hypothetical protein